MHKVLRKLFKGSNKRPKEWPSFVCQSMRKYEYFDIIPEARPRANHFKFTGKFHIMTLLEFDVKLQEANLKNNVRKKIMQLYFHGSFCFLFCFLFCFFVISWRLTWKGQ